MNGIDSVNSVTAASFSTPVAPTHGVGGLARMRGVGDANATDGAEAAGGGFSQAIADALARTNAAQHEAEVLAEGVQRGDPAASLESSMIAIAKANVSFQTAVQVRNKLVSAYHDLMNMQV